MIFRSLKDQIMITEMNNEKQMRDNIMNSISHEFMTPLNGQMLLLNTLMNHEQIIGTEIEQNVKVTKQCSDILRLLISDFLDYSKLNFQNLKLSFRQINVGDLVNSVVGFFNFSSWQRKIQIVPIFENGNENIFIFSDPDRIKQIFLKLLRKAIERTKQNTIIKIFIISRLKGF